MKTYSSDSVIAFSALAALSVHLGDTGHLFLSLVAAIIFVAALFVEGKNETI